MCLGALALSGQYQKDMTLICKSHGIGDMAFEIIYLTLFIRVGTK